MTMEIAKAKEVVYSYLEEQKIPYEVTEHEAVYTMDDMVALGLDKQGSICKNLFLKDNKGKRHFLIVADNDTKINLKELGEKAGIGKVSFASPERLKTYLGVEAGCVSPMGLLNDSEHLVEVILDQKLQGKNRLGVHPNEHTATLWISWQNLIKVLKSLGNSYKTTRL